MKKLIVFLLIPVVLISGCSFDVQVLEPVPAPSTTAATQSVATPPATLPAFSATPEVGFTPISSDPVFFAAYLSLDESGVPGQSVFPAGTKKIFAHWYYQNMREGMMMRRVWYLNGEPWLTREEPWSQAKYGVTGIMPDVSIYDLDVGLPSGIYQLRLYIDGVQQPIGAMFNGQPETWVRFEILPDESQTGLLSPDGQWTLFLSNGSRLILQDVNGSRTNLYDGSLIVSRAWMPDSRHILFVDRDPDGPLIGPAASLPGSLWIADIKTGEVLSLYKSETVLGEAGGLIVSPDGRYAVSIVGSGYGDACFLDSQLLFFEMAGDFQSVTTIRQEQFAGLPTAANGVMYIVATGAWQNDTQFSVPMKGTCDIDPSTAGSYRFDLPSRMANREALPISAGDLGWGEVHGIVTDAVTGEAIAGAMVTCEHNSYTSPAPCSGSAVTSAVGIYIFERIFFHDTDTIKLTITAPGYQPQEFTQTAFTTNDMMVVFSLVPLP